MKSYTVTLLVEFEGGMFEVPVDAENQADAENKAIEKLIDSYPIYRNRKITVYA